MKYDDASWQYGGDFPKVLPNEAGATLIAMFVVWCVLNGLAGVIHTDEDLNEQGKLFTSFYYLTENAEYLDDYCEVLSDRLESLYHASDTWEHFDKLAPLIVNRYHKWQSFKS